jgi:hypothetical protein
MTNNRRQLDCEEDDLDRFSYLNVVAVVLPLLLLAVVFMGETKKGQSDANSKGHQEVGGRREVPNPPTSQGVREDILSLPRTGGSPAACRLFDAIRQVESAGNDLAVGDKGVSRGPFQIKRAYWREAVAGTDAAGWSYDKWVWNRDRAEYVVWLHWCKVCPKELRAGNVEMLARRHRLPNDPWRKDNDKYWRKVKENING